MNLKCRLASVTCPAYAHTGTFTPNNATLTRLLPDLRTCAACIASDPPSLPAFRDDLIQIASVTLLEKGSAFDPAHKSGASFGSFIRPRICGRLMNAKRKELQSFARECPASTVNGEAAAVLNVEARRSIDAADFVDALIWEISTVRFEAVLPHLLKTLTPRERQVFACVRQDMPSCAIAKSLKLSAPRISQLIQNVKQKLRQGCRQFRLIE